MSNVKFNNFFYEKDDKYHKKGEERQNVNIRISLEDLIDDIDERNRIGLDLSLKYNSHIIREVIIDGEEYEIELLKLNKNKWYVYDIKHILEYDDYGTPYEFEEYTLEQLKNSCSRQLNLFDGFDYE